MFTSEPPRSAPTPAARVWVYLPASAFILYFGLLLFCDIRRPAFDAVIAVSDSGVVVRGVTPGSAADTAGLRPGDRIVSMNGRRLNSRVDWFATELMLPLNRSVALQLEREGTSVKAALMLAPAGFTYWSRREGLMLAAVRFVQAVTLTAALLVWWRRPSDVVGRLGGWLLATTAVFTVVPPYRLAAVWRGLPAPLAVILWIPHLSALAMGAVMFSFFAVFPRQWLRRSAVWLLAWTPMVLALAWHVRFVFGVLYGSGLHWDDSIFAAIILPVSAVYVLAGLALLVCGYRTLEGEVERRRTRIVVASSMAAWLVGVPVVVGYWARPRPELTYSLFASPLFALGTLWTLIFPLGFTYAILRHRLFDVPAIIRLGLQYAFARRALVSIVPLATLALFADVMVHRNETMSGILRLRGWLYAGLAVLAVVARLRRSVWLDALDRKFFREHYSAHRLLRGVAADIRRAGAFEAAARDVAARIDAALHPTVVAVLVRRDSARAFEAVVVAPSSVRVAPLDAESRLPALLRVLGKPLDAALADPRGLARQLPEEAQRWLERNGIELVVPVALMPEGQAAVLVLGPRRSEEPYGSDEKDLLQAIADSLALVLETSGADDDTGPMMECPVCGRCEAPRAHRCPIDGSTMSAANIPRRLGRRYRVEQRMARGGMATIYDAVDTQLGRRVAVKVLRDELLGSPAAIARFEREARLIAGLNHPNVVVVHDFGVTGNGAYLVMERLEGTTLRERLAKAGRLRPAEASALVRGMAAALEAAHARGIVHRDLKPENVFIVQQGPTVVAKILDFGIARLLSELPEGRWRGLTRAGELFGTPDYMAPEQSAGEKPSMAWDRWALAVMAYEMITGHLPEEGPEDELPSPLAAFFCRALSPDAARRPESASLLAAELDSALAMAYGAAS